MAGRQPRNLEDKKEPEILRTISVGADQDLYGPGEEDEFLEAYKEYIDGHNETEGNEGNQLDLDEELTRLSRIGTIINFPGVDPDEEGADHPDRDLNASRRAMVEEIPEEDGGTKTRRKRVAKTPRKRAAKADKDE